MTDGSGQTIYSIDSSSLMDWQARYYPPDVFPTLVDKMEALIAGGRLVAPALVKEEIDAIGPAPPHQATGAVWLSAARRFPARQRHRRACGVRAWTRARVEVHEH